MKLSDKFTVGVPDCHVTMARSVFVEIKETDVSDNIASWRKLKLSGAQDHKIRQMYRRVMGSACVVTAHRDRPSDFRLWVPMVANREGEGYELYRLSAVGLSEVMRWFQT